MATKRGRSPRRCRWGASPTVPGQKTDESAKDESAKDESASGGRRDVVILLLAIAGGGVDAIIILGFNVLTAAQTGNTILFVVALARHQLTTGLHAAVSILGYIIGAAVGEAIIVQRLARTSRLSPVGRALLAESILLATLLGAWLVTGPHPARGASPVLVTLAALGMGVQSAAVLRLHAGPTTTYVTGTLTTFATEAIRWLRLVDPARPAPPKESSSRLFSSTRPWIYGLTWLVYGCAALVSALVFLRTGAAALAVPIVAVLGAVAAGPRGPSEPDAPG